MVSKNQIKFIEKLQQKKYRTQYQMFLVEGKKSIIEFLKSGFEVEQIFVTDNFFGNFSQYNISLISKEELKKISSLKNPDDGVAIFKIPDNQEVTFCGKILALDDIRDPGNLGTIIRLCDWFGIRQLICSPQTVDCYNPKVVQSSMGSLTRVSIYYTDLQEFIKKSCLPTYATAMQGDNLYKADFPDDFILIMGNEANGISEKIFDLATKKITIPRFGNLQQTESLNVASATAIFLSTIMGN